ncbi:sigma-70 family RNA polymerase sigma factor, partial [Paenibacillus larvae]
LDLQEAMEHLKPEEKKTLILAYIDGYSQRTIAQELDISQMSVSRMQRRALSKLREYFKVKEPAGKDH